MKPGQTLIVPLGLLAALMVSAAQGQQDLDAQPQVELSPSRSELVAPPAGRDGTTIVGERESPIGLYITPWRNATPEKELDRPARFLEEALMPLDPEVFRRQLEYYNTISDHLRTAAPATPAPR